MDKAEKKRLGHYEVCEKVAEGGMAHIFLAKQENAEGVKREVALKCILPVLADKAEFVTMFLDEARLAQYLDHPNIVQIYEIGEEDGIYYIAMEYVQGPDLKQIIRGLYQHNGNQHPQHYAILAGIVAQAATGLHYAHHAVDDQGVPLEIVHRDVSPTNILISHGGNVKVLDFGVAKATTQIHKTRVGSFKGKLCYMSPEQLNSRSLDGRSDVFALGIVLFELTTGEKLFARNSEVETILAVERYPIPSLRRKVPGYPEELAKIVMKALERNRDNRYQNCEALRRDLEAFMLSQGGNQGPQEIAAWLQEVQPPGGWMEQEQKRSEDEVSWSFTDILEVEDDEEEKTELSKSHPDLGEINEIISSMELRTRTPSRALISSHSPLSSSRTPSRSLISRGATSLKDVLPSSGAFAIEEVKSAPKQSAMGWVMAILGLLCLTAAGLVQAFWVPPDDLRDSEELALVELAIRKQQYIDAAAKLGRLEARSQKGGISRPNQARIKLLRRLLQMHPKLDLARQLVRDKNYTAAKAILRKLDANYLPVKALRKQIPTKKPTPRPPPARPAPREKKPEPTGVAISIKPRCKLYLKRRKQGLSFPTMYLRLPPGTYIFDCINYKRGLAKRLRLKVKEGQTTKVNKVFPTGTLLIESKPWLDVHIKKMGKVGRSGKPITLIAGSHRLHLHALGKTEPKMTTKLWVKIRPGKTKHLKGLRFPKK